MVVAAVHCALRTVVMVVAAVHLAPRTVVMVVHVSCLFELRHPFVWVPLATTTRCSNHLSPLHLNSASSVLQFCLCDVANCR